MDILLHKTPYQQTPKSSEVAELLRAEVPVVPSGHQYAGSPDDYAPNPCIIRSAN